MPKKRLSLSALLAVSLLLLTAGSASAQKTIGWTSPTTPSSAYCKYSPYDAIQGGVSNPSISYTVPVPGVITSWSTSAWAGEHQQLTFKVFRPTGAGHYSVVAADLRSLTPSVMNTFGVSIPVQAGDVIGTQDTGAGENEHPTACAIQTGNAGDFITSERGDVGVGGSLEFGIHEEEVRLNISATVLAAPTVTSLGTTSGLTTGGTSVTIAGSEFADVQSVQFGSAAATYTVNSESQITATAPVSAAAGVVPVTVTTAAGKATAAQQFTYVTPPSCTVPKLKGEKLKVAKKALQKADCKLGKVTKKKGVTPKTGKVVKQSAKTGTQLAVGTKVNVKLG